MFEKLFKLPAVISRHQNEAFAEERRGYLLHCAQQGYAPTTLQVMADDLFWVARKLRRHRKLRVTPEQIIKKAAQDWSEREHFCGHMLNKRWTSARFVRVAKKWLRFLGHLVEPVDRIPFAHLLMDFRGWMEDERGLSLTTIERWSGYLKQFLCWYGAKKLPFSAVGIPDLDAFLTSCGAKGCSRISINNKATGLRAFFRYAGTKGWCDPLIAEAIKGPRIFAQENLPSGPSWQDVRCLLAGTETNRPEDIRDRSILMLFAVYGLRATEVTTLRLEDIDWEHDLIVVSRLKGRGRQIYPLSPTVGGAILRYLQQVRPRCSWREVFLTCSAPLRPISRTGLYSLTRRRMRKLGISSPHKGPHALRHACAAHLVEEGLSLKEIGDHLGHRSSSATRIYAKVDLSGLREVAAFDLGGLLMKLSRLVTEYIVSKQALGGRFQTEATILKSFSRAMGDIDIAKVQASAVQTFLAGKGQVTGFWFAKFGVLARFYRFLMIRNYVDSIPLPKTMPKPPEPMRPYIYTLEQLHRLLAAADKLQNPWSPLRAHTFHTLILTLYGTGLRIGEALSLTLADVNLSESLIMVRSGKFFKTRWVPIGPQLTERLRSYMHRRRKLPCPQGEDSAFFVTRSGNALTYDQARKVFPVLRKWAGISREKEARYQPRVHDIRHTMAVHRLVAWYREGANVQRLLPLLSTYLGHLDIAGTQRYLSFIPELRDEASRRFEHYALQEVKDED